MKELSHDCLKKFLPIKGFQMITEVLCENSIPSIILY